MNLSLGTRRDDSSIKKNKRRLKKNNWNGKIALTINEDCEGNSNEGTIPRLLRQKDWIFMSALQPENGQIKTIRNVIRFSFEHSFQGKFEI